MTQFSRFFHKFAINRNFYFINWRVFESIFFKSGSIGEFWRVLESFGEFWRVLESFGEFWRVLESFGEFWRVFFLNWRVFESFSQIRD